LHLIAEFALAVFFERAADDLARTEAYCEREREDDASEEDAEGEVDDRSSDLKVIEDHGGSDDEDHPLDAEREEARDKGAEDEEDDGSDGVGELSQKQYRYLEIAGVG